MVGRLVGREKDPENLPYITTAYLHSWRTQRPPNCRLALSFLVALCPVIVDKSSGPVYQAVTGRPMLPHHLPRFLVGRMVGRLGGDESERARTWAN